MIKRSRYFVADSIAPMCQFLDLPVDRLLRRAGLPADYAEGRDFGLLPHQVFALWQAGAEEYGKPDFPLRFGNGMAHGPFSATLFAFTCSPNVEIGLHRLAVFKPLLGPIALDIETTDAQLSISIRPTEPDLPLPQTLAATDIVFFVDLIRKATGEHVMPLAATLDHLPSSITDIEAHLGIKITQSTASSITFSLVDAQRPLVTENPDLWAYFETDLRKRLHTHNTNKQTTERLKSALLEMLPSGQSTVQNACDRLNLSKRSLQRHLHAEGSSFQSILDATRSELSLHYLRKDGLSIEEISYLLAYRDPNSFYRAFQNWTGMTPAQARAQT